MRKVAALLLLVSAAVSLVDPRYPMFSSMFDRQYFDEEKYADDGRDAPVQSHVRKAGQARKGKLLVKKTRVSKAMRKLHKNSMKPSYIPKIEPQCQRAVLTYFNIRVPQNQAPRDSVDQELDFCRGNIKTCCSYDDYRVLQPMFKRGAKRFDRIMEFVEEMLTVFRGKLFWNSFRKINQKTDCIMQQDGQKGTKKNLIKELFEKARERGTVLPDQRRQISNLLSDFKAFKSTTFYFYSNIICTVCDPVQNSKFRLETNHLLLSPDSCSQIIRNQLYELKLTELLNTFIYPIANYLSCHAQEESNSVASVLKTSIGLETIKDKIRTLNSCLYDLVPKKEDCQQYCVRRMDRFEFSHFTPFDLKSALKTIYEFVNKMPIEWYYEGIKKEPYENLMDEDKEVEFFERANIHHAETILENIDVRIEYSGANPFLSYMNKKFWSKKKNQKESKKKGK